MAEEEWRPVVGYEGLYEVSSLGRVRSLHRVVVRSNGVPQTIAERIRKPQPDRFGYLRVSLRKDGLTRTWLVHRIVAEAFIPNPEGFPYVLHGDSNPKNNRVGNLRWGTPQDNMDDAKRAGTADPWGHSKNPKPRCPKGHPYSGDNLYVDPRGRRVCRTCKREWARKNYRYRSSKA